MIVSIEIMAESMASNMCLDIHLHITLHHSITVFFTSSCTKRRASEEREMLFSMLRCVRKEGKVFFRLRLKKDNFVHNKALHMH